MAATKRGRFRRSNHVVAYWAPEGLVFVNYATGARTGADPLTTQILDFLGDWRSLDEIARRFDRWSAASVEAAVGALVERSLVLDSRRPAAREEALDSWSAWNPAAGFFHFTTKDVPFGSDLEAGGPVPARPAKGPSPPAVKPRARGRFLALPAERTEDAFPRTLLERRTWRRFSRGRLDKGAFATLIGLTFRIRKWMTLDGIGRAPMRTSPSPGARHSLEAYVLALRVEGVPRGLYHYSADRHGLERVRDGATPRQLASYLPTQWWYADAAALVLISAVFPRVWWRYDYPRAYRAVLIEAGHFCQTFLLTATWLGLAPFCSMALADSLIERDLGIDGVNESVLYAAGVGVRPPGVDWAPTPAPKRVRMSR